MITWGINAHNHDASISVFYNNYLLYAGHSERYSKVKNDSNLDRSQVGKLISEWGHPNQVFWFEKPILKYLRNIYSGQSYRYFSPKRYLESYGIHAPVEYVHHHEGHAASAFYTSGFDEAAVLVIDSIGEWNTVSIWKGSDKGLKKVYTVNYPYSIGLFYSAMTQRVGLKPNEEEYILMGMAAYGDPNKYLLDMKRDFFHEMRVKEDFHKGCRWWNNQSMCHNDIAAATQLLFEESLRSLAHTAKKLTGSDNLAYAGGCALNCSANGLLFDIFKNVWIFPNPGDSGLSVGAVLAKTKNKMKWRHNFLGYNLDLEVNYESMVDSLKQGKIVALAAGQAEFGPRALGNRSILADPRNPETKDKVNEIKRRQKFRPFAPSILEEHAHEYFEMPVDQSRFMQYAFKNKTDKLPATAHVDNTSRVQTVASEVNSHLRILLEMWYKETGCPALLNTSMNIKGQPIVNDANDAVRFMEMYNISVNE